MTGRKNAWTVSTSRCPIQSLRNKALYGTTGGTYSACIIRPVMSHPTRENDVSHDVFLEQITNLDIAFPLEVN